MYPKVKFVHFRLFPFKVTFLFLPFRSVIHHRYQCVEAFFYYIYITLIFIYNYNLKIQSPDAMNNNILNNAQEDKPFVLK